MEIAKTGKATFKTPRPCFAQVGGSFFVVSIFTTQQET